MTTPTTVLLTHSRRWLCRLAVLLALAGLSALDASAQVDTCKADTLRLNTGWNHTNNSLYSIGSLTPLWTVIDDPDSSTNEPRPAWTISADPAWQAALPDSRWISSYPGSTNNSNGTYTFQTCFCLPTLPQGATIRLVFDLRADDRARVYINGTLVASTPTSRSYNTASPTHFDSSINGQLSPSGVNCITVEVDNTNNVAMGLNFAGYLVITGPNPAGLGFSKARCCNPGLIRGVKFWDVDCDGIRDAYEPLLAGWIITAQNGSGTYKDTTDALGEYNLYVPAGSYTVSETMQSGWVQRFPGVPGTYGVTVAGGQAISNRDFGNCKVPPTNCISHTNDSVLCKIDPATSNVSYELRSTISSLLNCPTGLQSVSIFSATSNAGAISVSPNTFPISGTPTPYSFTITGSGATSGATIKLILRLCCRTSPTGPPTECCTDTLTYTLPTCTPASNDCLQILDDTVYCSRGAGGQMVYNYCFKVKNMKNFRASYFTLSGSGITFTPSTVFVGDLAPGQVSGRFCVQITGSSAVPGSLTFTGLLYNARRDSSCPENVKITLPDCGSQIKGCCDDWSKQILSLTRNASTNGTAGMTGKLSIAGTAGCERMTNIEASLVSVSINSKPAWGYFAPTNTVAGFGVGAITPGTNGQEVKWGPTAPTPLWGNSMSLALRFQPMASGVNSDVLSWCVKFRFTNECCVTCDTTVCFTVTRNKLLEPVGTKPGGGLGGGVIPNTNTGLVTYALPHFSMGAGTYVGFDLRALDGTIIDATSSNPNVKFFTLEGHAISTSTMQPDSTLEIDLEYVDYGAQNVMNHVLTVRYVLDAAPGDTVEEDIEFALRRSSAEGGDRVTPDLSASISDVKTFALHLTNVNGSEEPIDHVLIRTNSGVTVVAVGPTANDSTVMVGFRGGSEAGRWVAEARGVAEPLSYGSSQAPIYITFAGITENSTPVIEFVTLNAAGQPITTGQVTLDSPLSGSAIGDGVAGAQRVDGEGVAGAILGPSTPNPNSGRASIALRLDRSVSNASLVITDAMGREVLRPISGQTLGAGDHVVSVETAGLPAGTYFYTLRTASGAITRTFTVAR